jgi:hypothetical protein
MQGFGYWVTRYDMVQGLRFRIVDARLMEYVHRIRALTAHPITQTWQPVSVTYAERV